MEEGQDMHGDEARQDDGPRTHLLDAALVADPELLGDRRDEARVVRDEDDAAVPRLDGGHEGVDSLDIEVV